jgi:hypothetical protein
MAVLTSFNQLGGLLGDTFGTKVITRVIADGVYVFNDATATGTALADVSVYMRAANSGANCLPTNSLGVTGVAFTAVAAQTSRITFSGGTGASGLGVAAGAVVTTSGTLAFNAATGQVTIATAGRHTIDVIMSTETNAGNTQVVQLVKNGSTILATGNEIGRAQASTIGLTFTGTFAIGDTLDLRMVTSVATLIIYNLSWTVRQLPSTEVVPANSVPVTSLTRVQAGLAAPAGLTLALSGDVAFDTVAVSGGISMTAGVFSLLAGKMYRLKANLRIGSIVSQGPQFAWVNAITNAELVANAGRSEAAPSSQSNATEGNCVAEVLYTPSANTTVKLRYIAVGTGCRVEQYSTAIIEELPTSTTVNTGGLPVNAAVHIRANTTNNQGAPSGNVGNLVTWGNTLYDTTNSFVAATGTFTAPRTGYYLFKVCLMYGTITGGPNGRTGFIISRNGSVWGAADTPIHTFNIQSTNATNQPFTSTETKFMTAGDTAVVRLVLDGVTAATLAGSATYDLLQIDELVTSVF